jgi:hypothetical protein
MEIYNNNLYLFICIQAKTFFSPFKNSIKFKKLIICINPTLTLFRFDTSYFVFSLDNWYGFGDEFWPPNPYKNLTQVTLFLAWITGMDLATSSGLLLTTSEDGYVRQGGGHSLYILYIFFVPASRRKERV